MLEGATCQQHAKPNPPIELGWQQHHQCSWQEASSYGRLAARTLDLHKNWDWTANTKAAAAPIHQATILGCQPFGEGQSYSEGSTLLS